MKGVKSSRTIALVLGSVLFTNQLLQSASNVEEADRGQCFSLYDRRIEYQSRTYKYYADFFDEICRAYNMSHTAANGDDQLLFLIWSALIEKVDNDLKILLKIVGTYLAWEEQRGAQLGPTKEEVMKQAAACLKDVGTQECVASKVKKTTKAVIGGTGLAGWQAYKRAGRAKQSSLAKEKLNRDFQQLEEAENKWRQGTGSKSEWNKASKLVEADIGSVERPKHKLDEPFRAEGLKYYKDEKLKELDSDQTRAEWARYLAIAGAAASVGLLVEARYQTHKAGKLRSKWQQWKVREHLQYRDVLAAQFDTFLSAYAALSEINKIINEKVSGSDAEKSALYDMVRSLVEKLDNYDDCEKFVCAIKELNQERLTIDAIRRQCKIPAESKVGQWLWSIKWRQWNVTVDVLQDSFYQIRMLRALMDRKITFSKPAHAESGFKFEANKGAFAVQRKE